MAFMSTKVPLVYSRQTILFPISAAIQQRHRRLMNLSRLMLSARSASR